MTKPSQSQPEIVDIEDLDTFVKVLVQWHTTKTNTVKHMMSIPEGTAVSVNEGEDVHLEGELLKGFQLGLTVALSELGELPFSFTADEEDAAPQPVAHLN